MLFRFCMQSFLMIGSFWHMQQCSCSFAQGFIQFYICYHVCSVISQNIMAIPSIPTSKQGQEIYFLSLSFSFPFSFSFNFFFLLSSQCNNCVRLANNIKLFVHLKIIYKISNSLKIIKLYDINIIEVCQINMLYTMNW